MSTIELLAWGIAWVIYYYLPGVNYLVVDCRPKCQFDAGHLPGAFHLDPNYMLTGTVSSQ